MAMLWVIGNGKDCLKMIMPKSIEKFVIVESDEEKMSYLIEKSHHLPKMNPILLLLDFLLTHHLHLEGGTNISLPRLNLFNFMNLLVD
jgi:hypothetical protein